MALDITNITVFDHIEAARRINKMILINHKSGRIDHEKLMLLMRGQARNLQVIEDMLTAEVSAFHELPERAMHGLNQMIRDNEDKELGVEVALPAPTEGAEDNIVHVSFGKSLNPHAK